MIRSSWQPEYKIGEEIYIFIYKGEKDCDEMESTELLPEIILYAKVDGYIFENEQYLITPLEYVWTGNYPNYHKQIFPIGKSNTIHSSWVETFSPSSIEDIIKFLTGKSIYMHEKVEFT